MQQAIIINQKHLSAYDLTTNLIRGGLSSLDLSPNTKLVLLYLSTCYNEKKGVVFPKLKTIAKAVGISEISCKRAIKELLRESCILKSKRFKNSNEYVITKKILETKQNDTKKEQFETSKSIKLIPPMKEIKQKEIKEQQLKKVVEVVFSSSSQKKPAPIDIAEIPDIIRKNPKIKNVQAYWNSLSPKVQAEYILKDKELKEKKARQEAKEKEQEKRSYENYLKAEQAKKAKPLTTNFNKEQSIKYIQQMYSANQIMKKLAFKSRIVLNLVEKFNLNLEEILKV